MPGRTQKDREGWIEDAGYFEQAIRLIKQREELQRMVDRQNSCIVCGSSLLPSKEPPHCEDCVVTDEEDVS